MLDKKKFHLEKKIRRSEDHHNNIIITIYAPLYIIAIIQVR